MNNTGLLSELGRNDEIKSSKYERAEKLREAGDYAEACKLLEGLDFKDSGQILDDIKYLCQIELFSKAEVGSNVFFGTYEQDNDTSDGKEAIEWIVLLRDEDKLLLISRYTLDCKPYNYSYMSTTWETSDIRKWLNDGFIGDAFDKDETSIIVNSVVNADENPGYAIQSGPVGNSTVDRIFLLSCFEAEEYFNSDSARQCCGTDYCNERIAKERIAKKHIKGDTCSWWLRSPGHYANCAAAVGSSGSIYTSGYKVNDSSIAVRPALWISLDPSTNKANKSEEDILNENVKNSIDSLKEQFIEIDTTENGYILIKQAFSGGNDSQLKEVRDLIDKSDHKSELSEIYKLMEDLSNASVGTNVTELYNRVNNLNSLEVRDDIFETDKHMSFLKSAEGEYEGEVSAPLKMNNHKLDKEGIKISARISEGHITTESMVDDSGKTKSFESDIFCAKKGYKFEDKNHNSELSLDQGGEGELWIDNHLYRKR